MTARCSIVRAANNARTHGHCMRALAGVVDRPSDRWGIISFYHARSRRGRSAGEQKHVPGVFVAGSHAGYGVRRLARARTTGDARRDEGPTPARTPPPAY
jgi:hypothetical protein